MSAEHASPRAGARRPGRHGFGVQVASIVNVALFLVLAGVLLTMFLSPRDSEFLDKPFTGFLMTLVALGAGVLLARRGMIFVELSRRATVTSAVALTCTSCVVAYFSEFEYGWDPRAIREATYQLAETGHLDSGLLDYFARYPNNLPLALLETPLTHVARALGVPFFDVLVLWNGALFLGVLLLVARSLELLGRRAWTMPALVLLTLLLGLSPHMDMPYTDLPGCFLAALLVHLGVRMRAAPARLYPLMAAAALVSGFTYLIKPYVLVVPIAGVVMAALAGGMRVLRRRWGGRGMAVRLVLLPLLALGAMSLEKEAAYRNAHVSAHELAQHNAPFPVLHWVAMGLHDNHSRSPRRGYGSFDMDIMRRDVHIKDAARRNAVIRQGIEDDLRRQGVAGTAGFMSMKIAWVLGDSTFYAQKDGSDGRAHAVHPGPIAAMTLRNGTLFHVKAGAVQAVWAAMLMMLAWGLIQSRRDLVAGWLSLALLGFIAYESVFEGRPRYVVAVLPVFIVLLARTYPPVSGVRQTSGSPLARVRRASSST